MLMHSTVAAAPRGTGISVVQLLNGSAPFYRTYRCSDGKWFSVGAIEPKFYRNLLRSLDLGENPLALRQYDSAAWPAISELFAQRFAEKSRAEWTKLLVNAEACAFPVVEPLEMANDPHLSARGTASHRGGSVHIARAGRYVGEPATPLDHACPMGASTDEVLKALGYPESEILQLHAAGVIDSASGPANGIDAAGAGGQ